MDQNSLQTDGYSHLLLFQARRASDFYWEILISFLVLRRWNSKTPHQWWRRWNMTWPLIFWQRWMLARPVAWYPWWILGDDFVFEVTFSTVFVGGHVGAFLCILWQRYGRCVVMDVWSYQISKVSALFSAWCCYEEWFVGLMCSCCICSTFEHQFSHVSLQGVIFKDPCVFCWQSEGFCGWSNCLQVAFVSSPYVETGTPCDIGALVNQMNPFWDMWCVLRHV